MVIKYNFLIFFNGGGGPQRQRRLGLVNAIMQPGLTPCTHSLSQSINMWWETVCPVVKSMGFGSKEPWISILCVPLISTVAE